MITEQDLKEAIAECQGARNPNAGTCVKLASYLTIQKELFGRQQEEQPGYSFANVPTLPTEDQAVTYESETEFGQLIHGQDPLKIWAIVDEAMSAISVLQPQLYRAIIRKIED